MHIDFNKLFRDLNDPEEQARNRREAAAREAAQEALLRTQRAASELLRVNAEELPTKERQFGHTVQRALSTHGYLSPKQHNWLMDIAERLENGFKQAHPAHDLAAAAKAEAEAAAPPLPAVDDTASPSP